MTDPVTLALHHARLQRITDEMDAALIHAAFSPTISIGRQAAHGLYDPVTGNALVQSADGDPLLAGATPFAVRSIIAAAAEEGASQEGDVWICNDPWCAGPHASDVRLFRPVFSGTDVFGWFASAGRWDDIGGTLPQRANPRVTEGVAEGLLIPPVRIVEAGRFREDIARLWFANLRRPAEARGDLDAHRAALDAGAKGLASLLDKHGAERLRAIFSEQGTRAGRLFAATIAAWPTGTTSVDDALDNDGITDAPLPIALDLSLDADTLTLDFSRSARACRGPMNLSRATVHAACAVALRRILGDSAKAPGALDASVRIVISDGSILAAERPHPVGGHGETVLRVIDVVRQAMAALAPERVPACDVGTLSTLALAGFRETGAAWTMVSTFSGGEGARASADGRPLIGAPFSPVSMPPLEILEARFPVKTRRFGLRRDSGGPGRHRGGLGAIYEFELLDNQAEGFWLADRARTLPPGVSEGRAAAASLFGYETESGPTLPLLDSKEAGFELRRGKILRLETPGGGGHGDPFEREPAAVARDVASDYVSEEAARHDFGVALAPDGRVDALATATLRSGNGGRYRDYVHPVPSVVVDEPVEHFAEERSHREHRVEDPLEGDDFLDEHFPDEPLAKDRSADEQSGDERRESERSADERFLDEDFADEPLAAEHPGDKRREVPPEKPPTDEPLAEERSGEESSKEERPVGESFLDENFADEPLEVPPEKPPTDEPLAEEHSGEERPKEERPVGENFLDENFADELLAEKRPAEEQHPRDERPADRPLAEERSKEEHPAGESFLDENFADELLAEERSNGKQHPGDEHRENGRSTEERPVDERFLSEDFADELLAEEHSTEEPSEDDRPPEKRVTDKRDADNATSKVVEAQ